MYLLDNIHVQQAVREEKVPAGVTVFTCTDLSDRFLNGHRKFSCSLDVGNRSGTSNKFSFNMVYENVSVKEDKYVMNKWLVL